MIGVRAQRVKEGEEQLPEMGSESGEGSAADRRVDGEAGEARRDKGGDIVGKDSTIQSNCHVLI
jgi:hypothetical protein